MNTKSREQFRPSFTLAELKEILTSLQEGSAIYNKLAAYIFKISVGAKAASFIAQPKVTILDSLGGSLHQSQSNENVGGRFEENISRLRNKATQLPETLTNEDKLELYSTRFISDLESDKLTPEELEEAKKLELEKYGMNIVFI